MLCPIQPKRTSSILPTMSILLKWNINFFPAKTFEQQNFIYVFQPNHSTKHYISGINMWKYFFTLNWDTKDFYYVGDNITSTAKVWGILEQLSCSTKQCVRYSMIACFNKSNESEKTTNVKPFWTPNALWFLNKFPQTVTGCCFLVGIFTSLQFR